MSPEIVFSEDRLEYLADLFDKYIDEEGFLRDAEDDQLVRDEYDEEPIRADELGIVHHSSEHFVRNEVGNLLQHAKETEE